jgi:hypothetical protein
MLMHNVYVLILPIRRHLFRSTISDRKNRDKLEQFKTLYINKYMNREPAPGRQYVLFEVPG